MASGEEGLHSIVEAFIDGVVVIPAKLGEFLKGLALFGIESGGNFDLDVGEDVTFGDALKGGHAKATNTESGATLGACGNFQVHSALEGGDTNLTAERGGGKGNRHLAGEIHAVAGKNLVLLDVNDDVKITGRASAKASLSATSAAKTGLAFDAGGDFDFDATCLFHTPFALAGVAGLFNDATGAVTGRAGLSDLEKAARCDHLTTPAAGRAGDSLGAFLRPGAATRLATIELANLDFLFTTPRRLLEGDLQIVAQVGSTLAPGRIRTAPASTKELLEAGCNIAALVSGGHLSSNSPSKPQAEGAAE